MDTTPKNNNRSLRYWMFVPLVLMIASVVSGCISYNKAEQNITDDLNEAILALTTDNSNLWTQPDTIAALRRMYETTHKPIIYQASDLNFKNASLKESAYYTLALIDKKTIAPKIQGHKIASDSIMLVPEKATDGLAIQVQGFAEYSMASVFAVSDQTLPGVLLSLSIISMMAMIVRRRKETELSIPATALTTTAIPSLDRIKLTPMQRHLTQMLLDAPNNKVDKSTLCEVLWDNKSNAEESLYTLVRRTKIALADANVEIICNRGDSYELRIID